MAVSFSNSGNGGFYRSSDLLNYNNPYTIMAWVYISNSLPTDGEFYSVFSVVSESVFPYVEDALWYVDRVLTAYAVLTSGTEVLVTESGNTVFNAWNHIAMVRNSSTSLSIVINGAQYSAPTLDISSRPSSTHEGISYYTAFFPAPLGSNHRFCHQYRYNAALSLAEIQDQMYFGYPRRTANLREWLPMEPNSSRNVDFSGNNRNYTETGTIANTESLNLARPALSVIPYYAPPPVYYASPLMLTAC